MTHPLTEEIMYKLHRPHAGYSDPFGEDDMRAAADWQLEQVIEWINGNLYWVDDDNSVHYLRGECVSIYPDELIHDLKKAMRPQQQQEDN